MKGDLTKDCLPDILRYLYANRDRGELKLSQNNQRKSIYFELGAIVFASSNAREDRIGETMMRHGMLSKEDFERASEKITRGKRFGRVLVELGIVSERDLLMNVTFQILDIIYSVFEWTTGQYEFVKEEKLVPEDLRLDLSTASIILEGVRRIKDFGVIQRGLGDLNRLIGPSTNPLLRLQTLSLKPIERQIIEAIKEPMNILQTLLLVKAQQTDSALKALYGLLCAGILDRFGSPEINSKTGKLEIPPELYEKASQAQPIVPPKVAQAVTKTGKTKSAEMINTIRRRIATEDPHEILGVTKRSTREEIRDAYYSLAKDFHPDRYLGTSREIQQEIEQIFTQITSSYDALKNPTTAQSTISAQPSPINVDTPAQRAQRAEQLHLEARNRFLSKDYLIAATLLKEAVRLDPSQARYFLLLGNVLATQQKTLKEAEGYLLKAQEMDPFNAICRASLGQLYMRAGMPKRADTEFHEALKLDSTQQIALRGLETLENKNQVGLLQKIFKR